MSVMDDMLLKIRSTVPNSRVPASSGKSFDRGISTAVNKIKVAPQRVVNEVTKPIKGIASVVGEFTTSPSTLPKDYKYRIAKVSEGYKQKMMPVVSYEQSMKTDERLNNMWNNLVSKGPKATLNAPDLLGGEINAHQAPSADMYRLYWGAPVEDAKGKLIKNKIANNPYLTAGVKSYIKTIPVTSTGPISKHAAGVSYNFRQPDTQDFVVVDPRILNPKIPKNVNQNAFKNDAFERGVTTHEIFHQLANIVPPEHYGDLATAFQKAYTKNPEKYQGIMDWLTSYKEGPLGDNFNRQGYEQGELFAELGAVFGEQVMNDKDLAPYYAAIFQSAPPTLESSIAEGAIFQTRKPVRGKLYIRKGNK